MSWIFIQAEDVLFFRDTRSFGKGEDHLAHCIFPPYPITIAGAIRSRIIGDYSNWDQKLFNDEKIDDLMERIGSPKSLGPKFSIKGPFLARKVNDNVQCYSPIPADSFVVDSKKNQFNSFKPKKVSGLVANWPGDEIFPLWPMNDQRKDAVEGSFWLSGIAIKLYQTENNFIGEEASKFFSVEKRIGIGKDQLLGTVKSQMLYTAPFIRINGNNGLLVWVADEVKLPQNGMFALGGESRTAYFTTIPDGNIQQFPEINMEGKNKLKVVLQTPAFLGDGWKPKNGDWSQFGLPKGAKLRAASLGRPQMINGWDIARGRQKTLCSYVPIGSVFYFEWDAPLQHSIKTTDICLTESPGSIDYKRLGFGQVILSHWNWQE